jgi:hypothetical protein
MVVEAMVVGEEMVAVFMVETLLLLFHILRSQTHGEILATLLKCIRLEDVGVLKVRLGFANLSIQ